MKLCAFSSVGALLLALLAGCQSSSSGPRQQPGEAPVCPAITGQVWVPPPGDPRAHDPSTAVSVEVLRIPTHLRGLIESPTPVDAPFSIGEDLGSGGSISLIAEIEDFPEVLGSGAHPILFSLSDGVNEFLPLSTSGGASCNGSGLFCCGQALCDLNPLWKFSGPAAYADPDFWLDHQISPFGFVSVNTFPNCHWSDGESAGARTRCFFGDSTRFPGGMLRKGSYVARYAVTLAQLERNPLPDAGAILKLSVIRKKKAEIQSGALDLNVILVGSRNVQDSRTPGGARNLDALIEMIRSRYAGSGGTGIPLGKIQVFEWNCEQGGEAFAQLKLDDIGTLFARGSVLVGENATHALNLFMVSNLLSGDSRVTLLGVSGGIGGPLVAGTAESGLAFASFGRLGSADSDGRDLRELGETISHEMGHFLGLSHPTEADALRHDPVPDTPTCLTPDPRTPIHMITHRSCRELDSENPWPVTGLSCLQACPSYDGRTNFCPQAGECQFNHLMWWTVKNWNGDQGDGSLITPQSDRVLRMSPAIQ